MKWSGEWGGRKSKYTDDFMAKFRKLAETHTAGELAEELGMRKEAVVYLSRRDNITISKTSQRARVSVRLKGEIIQTLAEEAKKRNISTETLAERLLIAIVKDKIFNAVLDDEKLHARSLP